MITDAQIDGFLNHDERCLCPNCMAVVEHLSRTYKGLSFLNLISQRGMSKVNKQIERQRQR